MEIKQNLKNLQKSKKHIVEKYLKIFLIKIENKNVFSLSVFKKKETKKKKEIKLNRWTSKQTEI